MVQKGLVLGLTPLVALALVGMPAPAAAELKVGVSGYIKLDVLYEDKITGSSPAPGPGSTPLDSNRALDNSQTIIDARQSRLRATFSDDVAGVKISGRIEGDFFTGDGNARVSNSRHFRLRHAFARGDHPSGFFILAGQTWGLSFNANVAAVPVVDFNGPAGQLFSRQPQFRVGYKTPAGGGNLIVEADIEKHSLENLGSAVVDEGQGSGQDVPVFTGKVSWLSEMVGVEGAFAVAENQVTFAGGGQESETAWLGTISVQVNFEPFKVFGHYQHTDGLGRLANQDFPGAVSTGPTSFSNVETDGFYVGGSWNATKNTSVNAIYGWNEADSIPGAFDATTGACPPGDPQGPTGCDLETHQSIHVNVIHKFWKRWQAGLEYRRFFVEAFNGEEGDVNIIHGAVWYFF